MDALLRYASAIDRPKPAAFISQVRAALSLRSRAEVKRSGTSLDLSERANNNRNKVLRDHKGHQNRSKAFLAV
jgi:hypothetical protein